MMDCAAGWFTDLSEQVTRHRGGGRDSNGQLSAESSTELTAIAVAPGGGSVDPERARHGVNVACTVYFAPGTDLATADELTVRGERFRIIVNDWPKFEGCGGLEVLCTRGQG